MEFPVSSLRPTQARLVIGATGQPSIVVSFAQFALASPDEEESEALHFDTEPRADFVDLPTTDLNILRNRAFEFPENPADGYIDASVYFANTHCPVDITKLVFGNLENGEISMTMVTKWIMTLEGTGFDDFDLTFTVQIRS